MTAAAMLGALALDSLVGWPARLYARIGHPVVWIGALISRLDRAWNRGSPARRRHLGLLALVVIVAVPAGLATAVVLLLPAGPWGLALTILLASPWLAAKSLAEHVAAVAAPLAAGDHAAARIEVAKIVGRDPETLDTPGIARAALESLGENASDGVVAPLFWGVLLGLPGLVAYKAINTADSMIAHLTPRHRDFGRATARADDLVNGPPARLTALALALAAGRPRAIWATVRRDARGHRSPNAGWPETALAAALGVRLSGPRAYGGDVEPNPWLNAGARDPEAADISKGLALYRRSLLLIAALLGAIALAQGLV